MHVDVVHGQQKAEVSRAQKPPQQQQRPLSQQQQTPSPKAQTSKFSGAGDSRFLFIICLVLFDFFVVLRLICPVLFLFLLLLSVACGKRAET